LIYSQVSECIEERLKQDGVVARSQQQTEDLIQEKTILRDQLDRLTAELSNMQSTNGSLSQKLHTLHTSLEQSKLDATSLRPQLQEVVSELAEVRILSERQDSHNNSLQSQLISATDASARLETELSDANLTIQSQNALKSKIEQDLSMTRTRLEQEVNHLKTEIQSLLADKAVHEQLHSKLQSDLAALRQELMLEASNHEATRQQRSVEASSHEATRQQKTKLQSSFAQLQQDFSAESNQCEVLKRELAQCRAECVQVRTELMEALKRPQTIVVRDMPSYSFDKK
jgi:chromosome segregation ATPase